MMRHPRLAFASTVVSFLALTGTALAQEPAAAEAPAAPAPTPPEAAPPAAPPEATPVAATAEAPAAAEAAPAEEPAGIPAWFRIDSDLNGLQLWAGATHDLGGVALASDMYVYSYAGGSFGEFDIGPAFSLADGAVIITPMIGINFNWSLQKTNAIVPQLYFVGGGGPLYFESWWQLFLQKPFEDEFNVGLNYLYTRNFATFGVSEDFGIGPAVEAWISFDKDVTGETFFHLPIGGIAKLAYGEGSTFFGFLGYEVTDVGKEVAGGSGDRAIVGRLTFVKNF
jgi:hypothetical protein